MKDHPRLSDYAAVIPAVERGEVDGTMMRGEDAARMIDDAARDTAT